MRFNVGYTLLIMFTAFAFLLSLAMGEASLTFSDMLGGLMGNAEPVRVMVMQEIRLPRALLALLVGASLGMAGAALQGYTRNPLAEPGMMGISSGAALGAVLVLYTGLAAHAVWLLPLAAMLGAMLASALILSLSLRTGDSAVLLLAGAGVSSLCAAMISIVLNLSPSPFAVMEIIFWMMGSLADKPLAQVLALLPVMLAGMIVMLLAARALDAMALGRETAMSLGISLPWLQFALVSGMALSVGAATALSGMIGFVGLVVPHLLRQLFRLKPSALLLPSALGGGLLLLLADSLARIIPTSGTELRIGVVTALIGAPFFLWLLLRYRREGSL